ncbi:MAG TPA: HD domain-containing phosphohydrolase [Burkholderiaceae bacterium]
MNDPSPCAKELSTAAQVLARPLVLCVDDEPNILSSLRRALRHPGWRIVTVSSGPEALDQMRREPADVVISDMRMPDMDGVRLLEQVRDHWPETIRILLTGHAEVTAAIAAINRGRIFRYINKPWDDVEIKATVHQGLELIALQRDKARLEELTLAQNLRLRELNEELEQRVLERTKELADANRKLKKNFLTSIKLLSNLLELRGGRLLGHGRRVAELARTVARAMALDDQQIQDIFVAGLLHDVGHVVLPDALLQKPVARLSQDELVHYRQHCALGEQLLMALEEMQNVAALIYAHHERYDGRGYPDALAGSDIALGARILAVVDTYDELQNGHLGGAQPSASEARVLLQQGRGTQFDPEVLEIFLQVTQVARAEASTALILGSDGLEPNMVLAADLISPEGVLLLSAGHRLTDALIRRVRVYELRAGQQFRLHIQRA